MVGRRVSKAWLEGRDSGQVTQVVRRDEEGKGK